MALSVKRIVDQWSVLTAALAAVRNANKKIAIGIEAGGIEALNGTVFVSVVCATCGIEFTQRGKNPIQLTCHRCNERDLRFCTCDKCIRERENCRRCGLEHESYEANWKCEACGAILCVRQIGLVGGFSERCVHVVFPKKGSPVIEFGETAKGTHKAYSICGDVVRIELNGVCPDCGMYDGQECEKHSHRRSS